MRDVEAGRELDALVGEKIMGWRWIDLPTGKRPVMVSPGQWERYTPEARATLHVPDCRRNPPARLPAYSEDIAAAWEVVGKIGCMTVTPCDDGWLAFSTPYGEIRYPEIYNDGQDGFMDVPIHTDAWATAQTAPLAICLAALKAVGATP